MIVNVLTKSILSFNIDDNETSDGGTTNMPTTLKQSTVQEVIDATTGEVLRKEENKTYNFSAEPPYIKLYLQDILYLSDLPKTHDKVLLSLLQKATWASAEYGMVVVLSAGMKRMMCEKLNLKNVRSINNVLTDFVKADILKRIDTGVYQLNPYLFGRGDWQDVAQLRMEVAYTLEGRTFQSMIDYKNNIKTDANGVKFTEKNLFEKGA